MSNSQNFDVQATISAVKESHVFKNLCSDVTALIKSPETWFRQVYQEVRFIESLVLIAALILSKSLEIIGINLSMPTNLNLGSVSYHAFIPALILDEALQLLVFFGIVVLIQIFISSRYSKPSVEDLKTALVIFAYGFIPLTLISPLIGLSNLMHIGYLDLLSWALEATSMMLISLGLLSRKNEAIQMNFFILLTTILIIGRGICGFVI